MDDSARTWRFDENCLHKVDIVEGRWGNQLQLRLRPQFLEGSQLQLRQGLAGKCPGQVNHLLLVLGPRLSVLGPGLSVPRTFFGMLRFFQTVT